MNQTVKENIEWAVYLWQRVRGSALRRYAGYLIVAAMAALSNVLQYVITAVTELLGKSITISETPSWLVAGLVVVAFAMLVVDRIFPEREKTDPELKKLIEKGEDIIRRQKIMFTDDEWRRIDPGIGVRNEEGALWRDEVRTHIKKSKADNPEILKELDRVLDINVHIFDEKFNLAHGTRAGFIDSYLNHSYRIQSFLKQHG